MKFNDIMALPKETKNTDLYDMLLSSVTEEDKNNGTNPETFAYAHLIEWAIMNKKFDEFYSMWNPLIADDKERWALEKYLTESKTVIVRFNFASTPLFGFLGNNDGSNCITFPAKDGMKCFDL